jgi:hypothetical protein
MCLQLGYKKTIFFWHPQGYQRKELDPDPLVRGAYPRIRIPTQMCHELPTLQRTKKSPVLLPLLPDGRILGRWTQKWPSKITCGLGNQQPIKWPNSKFPNCGLILAIIGKKRPNTLHT